jgi:hypothetical protein
MKSQTTQRDRPVNEGSYLLRFFGFACIFGLCGEGGDVSMRRNTSSSVGAGGSLRLFMV